MIKITINNELKEKIKKITKNAGKALFTIGITYIAAYAAIRKYNSTHRVCVKVDIPETK